MPVYAILTCTSWKVSTLGRCRPFSVTKSSGVVEQVGSDVTYVKPGDHVVTCLSVFCGACEMCTTGRPVLCTGADVKLPPGSANRFAWSRPEKLNQFLNLSSFAEQMLVHENAIVKIRKDMPLDLAALIGCAIVTGFGAVVNTAKVRPGETVAVIGCGGVGMAAIQRRCYCRCRPYHCPRHQSGQVAARNEARRDRSRQPSGNQCRRASEGTDQWRSATTPSR